MRIVTRTLKTYEPINQKFEELPLKTIPTPATPTLIESLSEQEAFNRLVGRESSLDPLAVNRTSFACGIPQSNPCEKLLDYAQIQHPSINSYALAKEYIAKVPKETQIAWMWQYIKARYGNASNALAFHDRNGYY